MLYSILGITAITLRTASGYLSMCGNYLKSSFSIEIRKYLCLCVYFYMNWVLFYIYTLFCFQILCQKWVFIFSPGVSSFYPFPPSVSVSGSCSSFPIVRITSKETRSSCRLYSITADKAVSAGICVFVALVCVDMCWSFTKQRIQADICCSLSTLKIVFVGL
jgi:hypothetical protein